MLSCNKLFYLERTLKDLNPEERKHQRDVLEQPVWDQFWNWLDGRCEISNNRAERKAKSYAISRKMLDIFKKTG